MAKTQIKVSTSINRLIDDIRKFVSKNRIEIVLVIAILVVGAFCRLYQITAYMTFLGDEGRDAIIVRNLLVHRDPILIGPGTSIGSMYLGPLYYYFMAPFLLLSNFSPVGPAIGVALLGTLTIYLVYVTGKAWFGKKAGLVSSLLYALSPTVIMYSRSSWNPNIMPFFALMSVYSMWKAYSEKKYGWLFPASVSFAFVLQSHYLGILIFPVLLVYLTLMIMENRTQKRSPGSISLLKSSLISLSVFTLLMSPLVFFDFRHDFLNSKALYKFLTVRQETVSIRPWTAIPKSYPIYEQINISLLGANNVVIGKYISLFLLIAVIWFGASKYLRVKPPNALAILIFWFAVSLIGFGIYKQHVYDHYYGFLFPVPFLLFGAAYQKLFDTKFKLPLILVLILVTVNLIINSPIRKSPNNQMVRSQKVAQKISEESSNEKFNLAVIAERNYEDGYQYFLEKDYANVVEIDSQIPETVTSQLFVVCEVNGSSLTEKTCDPTHSPKAEVANFGWSKIETQWEVDGVIIYKLVHTEKI